MPKKSKQDDIRRDNLHSLLNQRIFYFNEKEFDAFNKSLATQTTKNEKLEKLLSIEDCWGNI